MRLLQGVPPIVTMIERICLWTFPVGLTDVQLNKHALIISVHRLHRSARSRRDESAALHGHLKCATTPEQTYRPLPLRGRTSHQTVLAVGRELLGFILAIASVVKVTSDQTATA
jgi:hypothetical protein